MNGEAENVPLRKKGKIPFRGIIASMVVAAGGVTAWLVLALSGEAPAQNEVRLSRSKIRTVEPVSRPAVASMKRNAAPVVKVAEPEYKLIRAVTNRDGAVVQDVVMPDGSLKMIVKPPRQVWHNAADQLIAMAISIAPGETAAPLPTGVSDDDFRRALKKDIVIYNDDTPEVKELKQRVRETRNEILEIMNQTHRSFDDILQEHCADMNSNAKAYQDAVKGLAEVRKNGSPEDVKRYVTVMNAALQQVGAKELPYDEDRPMRRGRGTISTKGTRQ